MKLELEGYLYIVTNGYDQYEVDEAYFTESMDGIAYEKVDRNSYNNLRFRNYSEESRKMYCQQPPKVQLKAGEGLVEILKDKLSLVAAEEKWELDHTHTFQPQAKKFKITIEEIKE